MIRETGRKACFSPGRATGALARARRNESWPTSTTVSSFDNFPCVENLTRKRFFLINKISISVTQIIKQWFFKVLTYFFFNCFTTTEFFMLLILKIISYIPDTADECIVFRFLRQQWSPWVTGFSVFRSQSGAWDFREEWGQSERKHHHMISLNMNVMGTWTFIS